MSVRVEALALELVHYMPPLLSAGVLYVSEEFGVAIHLCACGCGEKVVTPLDARDGWEFASDADGPTLTPSIDNHQIPCRTHYHVRGGRIEWCL